ncbi:MAG: hypothetical protein ACR2IY_13515, partial [Rubrivivax sp.]
MNAPSAARPLAAKSQGPGEQSALDEGDLRTQVRDLQRALAAQRESLDALAQARERDRQEAAAAFAQES